MTDPVLVIGKCMDCGKIWRGKTCMGETTYEEVKNDQSTN
jgi:hypothetical protein